MYPELITRPDIKVFLPPIGGMTVYICKPSPSPYARSFVRLTSLVRLSVGPASYMYDETKELTLRVHDECNGSDVFGSDICTCKPYLVFAMCALAAPLSKQPRLRTTPARYAGRPFAQEALSLMFDGAGRLVCEPSLAVAQALCLLQIHDTRVGGATAWNMRYHGAFGSFPASASTSTSS